MKNTLSPRELEKVTVLQQQMLDRFSNVPSSGLTVEYNEKKFIILPNVFWPFEDSKAIASILDISQEDEVLDVGTGSGVLAILAAYKNPKKVVALDINPYAIENARMNALLHGFEAKIEVRQSDMLDAILEHEKFDKIIANLPFRNRPAKTVAEKAMWDQDFATNRKFFSGIKTHLKQKGKIYFAQSNFGNVEEVIRIAESHDFDIHLEKKYKPSKDDLREFYAFILTSK